MCGAWYIGPYYLGGLYGENPWMMEPWAASVSYSQLAGDARHSEGQRYALELNTASEGLQRGDWACHAAPIANDSHAGEGGEPAPLHSQDGTAVGPAPAQTASVQPSEAACAAEGSQGASLGEQHVGPPSWCGCDLAWFNRQTEVQAAIAEELRASALNSGGSFGSPNMPATGGACLWKSAYRAVWAQLANWMGAWQWLHAQLKPLVQRVLPSLVGESGQKGFSLLQPGGLEDNQETVPGAGEEAPPQPRNIPPSAYLGL